MNSLRNENINRLEFVSTKLKYLMFNRRLSFIRFSLMIRYHSLAISRDRIIFTALVLSCKTFKLWLTLGRDNMNLLNFVVSYFVLLDLTLNTIQVVFLNRHETSIS